MRMENPTTSTARKPAPTPENGGRTVDWASIRARLESVENGSQTMAATPEHVAAVLRQRAKILAEPLPLQREDVAETGGDSKHVVLVRLGGQDFAIEAAALREAMESPRITPLPGLPATLRGLANVRSRIVPAYDIRALLNLPPLAKDAPREKLVLIAFDGAEFGLLVDAVLGAREIVPGQLHREVSGLATRFIQGVTRDGLILLDLSSLVAAFLAEDGES